MGNKFIPKPGVEELVARMILPRIDEVAKDVEVEAKRLAPGTKVWVTMADGKVCDHCTPLHGVEMPSNLRFEAKAFEWERLHRGAGEHVYLLFPKDETSNAVVMIKHCRCTVVTNAKGLEAYIHTSPARARGREAHATVFAEGHGGEKGITNAKIIAAERGEQYPHPTAFDAEGARFMERAARNVARRRRGLSGGGEINHNTQGF